MATYLDILNRARGRQAGTPISATGIGDGSGDSLQGIEAVNNAVAVFSENSFDLDATEKVASITTTSGTTLLTAPSPSWDTNVIKAVKWLESGKDYLQELTLIDLDAAEEYKLKTFTDNNPRFWYVNNGNVYVLPSPTASYTLKVFYQQMYPDITADEMNDTIILPKTALKTLTDGVYSYLREQSGDPQWIALYQSFEASVKKFYQRNKHTYKRRGRKKFRVVPNRADRRL